MVGGILGVLLTGVFASLVINAAGAAASFAQLGKQAVLAGVTVAFSFAATMLILKVTDATVGLRLPEEHEEAGLDSSQHGRWATGSEASVAPRRRRTGCHVSSRPLNLCGRVSAASQVG
jgi:ammonia channel protein AmtB